MSVRSWSAESGVKSQSDDFPRPTFICPYAKVKEHKTLKCTASKICKREQFRANLKAESANHTNGTLSRLSRHFAALSNGLEYDYLKSFLPNVQQGLVKCWYTLLLGGLHFFTVESEIQSGAEKCLLSIFWRWLQKRHRPPPPPTDRPTRQPNPSHSPTLAACPLTLLTATPSNYDQKMWVIQSRGTGRMDRQQGGFSEMVPKLEPMQKENAAFSIVRYVVVKATIPSSTHNWQLIPTSHRDPDRVGRKS